MYVQTQEWYGIMIFNKLVPLKVKQKRLINNLK